MCLFFPCEVLPSNSVEFCCTCNLTLHYLHTKHFIVLHWYNNGMESEISVNLLKSVREYSVNLDVFKKPL